MDLGGAVKCIEAAQELGVDRFLMVSSMGTRDIDPGQPDEALPGGQARRRPRARGLRAALDDRAARRADERARARAPSPSRRVLGRFGEIARDDVALVLYHCLFAENTVHGTFDLLDGPEPVENAVLSFTSR